LNTSILTAFGDYRYEPLSLEEVRALVRAFFPVKKRMESTIAHKSTAELLNTLFSAQCRRTASTSNKRSRISDLFSSSTSGHQKAEPSNRKELEEIGNEFRLLTRIA